ncbi:MAG: RNA methyltransferase substrate-binding domain-containing protein, partial [Flavobacteriales bacterium]
MSKKKNIIYGIHAMEEAIEAGRSFDKVLIKQKSNSDSIKRLIQSLNEHRIPIKNVPSQKLDKITGKPH